METEMTLNERQLALKMFVDKRMDFDLTYS